MEEAEAVPEVLSDEVIGNAMGAIEALKGVSKQKQEDKKTLFPDQEIAIRLLVVLKKVPTSLRGMKVIKTPLVHAYRDFVSTSTCLFVKDISKEKLDPDVDKSARFFHHFLKVERGQKGINEVIGCEQLKREYKTFEAKRKLANAFDIFLVDERVHAQIFRNLGRSFYNEKKLPVDVCLTHQKDVTKQIRKAMNLSRLIIHPTSTRGCCTIGTLKQSISDLVDNLRAVLEKLSSELPGKETNIRSLYLSAPGTPEIPIYASFQTSNAVVLPGPSKKHSDAIIEEVSTLEEGAKVKIYPDGRVEVLDEDGNVIPDSGTPGKSKKRKRKFSQKKERLRRPKGNKVPKTEDELKDEVKDEEIDSHV